MGDNIILFSESDIISSNKIDKPFFVTNSCLCLFPKKHKLELILSNRKNKVYILK